MKKIFFIFVVLVLGIKSLNRSYQKYFESRVESLHLDKRTYN